MIKKGVIIEGIEVERIELGKQIDYATDQVNY